MKHAATNRNVTRRAATSSRSRPSRSVGPRATMAVAAVGTGSRRIAAIGDRKASRSVRPSSRDPSRHAARQASRRNRWPSRRRNRRQRRPSHRAPSSPRSSHRCRMPVMGLVPKARAVPKGRGPNGPMASAVRVARAAAVVVADVTAARAMAAASRVPIAVRRKRASPATPVSMAARHKVTAAASRVRSISVAARWANVRRSLQSSVP